MNDLSEFGGQQTSNRRFLAIRRPIWPHVFMALFGAGWSLSIDVGFRLYGAEVITILGLILIPWRSIPNRFPMLKRILAAFALWVVAIGLSDMINGTPLFNSIRHISTPIIGGASLVFVLSVLSRKPSALLTFLAVTAIAKATLGDAAYGDTFANETLSWATIEENTNLFKVRIAPFLTPAVILIACWVGRRNLLRASTLLLLTSVVYLVLDFRSTGLTLFLSSMILTMTHTGFRSRISHLLIISGFVVILGYFAYVAYIDYTMNYNRFGHNGIQLAKLDNPYNPFALLFQGRSEWSIFPALVTERPLFGWGSWAEDKDNKWTLLRLALTQNNNLYQNSTILLSNYIPVHSLIGAAIVWSGLLGLISMLWFLRTVLTMGFRLLSIHSYLLPAVVFLTFDLLWSYFFSPSVHVRLSFPVALAALIILTAPKPHQKYVTSYFPS